MIKFITTWNKSLTEKKNFAHMAGKTSICEKHLTDTWAHKAEPLFGASPFLLAKVSDRPGQKTNINLEVYDGCIQAASGHSKGPVNMTHRATESLRVSPWPQYQCNILLLWSTIVTLTTFPTVTGRTCIPKSLRGMKQFILTIHGSLTVKTTGHPG